MHSIHHIHTLIGYIQDALYSDSHPVKQMLLYSKTNRCFTNYKAEGQIGMP